ncbi:hypothetical protein [Calothrix sp. NIES-3974]|uniref:hypothetical protein n=1 Tax=Calothrix sp. NIES-3974 TaxID=2005462 RepID=UPI000B5DF85B|nr:hypothetical protein [Calothrix sp. NIES-3974]BAZ05344.1 hypothetical protein NIES3974_19910 [Calothrix sp. NIES-3974]
MPNPFSHPLRLTVGAIACGIASFGVGCFHSQLQSRANNTVVSSPATSELSTSARIMRAINAQAPTNVPKQPTSSQYQVIDEQQNYQFTIDGRRVISNSKLPTQGGINFNQSDMLTTLVNTRKYFQDYAKEDPIVLREGILGTQGVTVGDILKTLDFMIAVLQEDIQQKRPSRLQDTNFINNNFRVLRWSPHNPKNPNQNRLRLTKYAVFTHTGSREKTSQYNAGIYALKDNLVGDDFYKKYTKQDVLQGIYEPGGKEFGRVQPLAYLTRTGLEDALMQGTILINFTNGTRAFFNVDRNNGIPFKKGVNPRDQGRYWYFRQVDAIKGYGYKIDAKISIKPGVTFAGDINNIGLGRIVVLESGSGRNRQMRMGVIADTGGAFLPNLYQLDYLAGIFPNQAEFQRYIRTLPEFLTNTYILVKK